MYGVPTLYVPDEGRYAEIAREMLVTHQYLVPHLNGMIYFEKPPLIYWMTTFFIWIFGQNDWGARFVNVFIAYSGLIATYFTVSKIYANKQVALWSSLIACTSILYLVGGRYLNLDVGVAVFINLSLMMYWLSTKYTTKSWQGLLLLVASFFFAWCAIMTKGFIGIIFPAGIIFLWAIIVGEYKRLLDWRLYVGAVLAVLLSLPWIYWVNQAHPGFAYYYVMVQQILRYTTDEQSREMSKFLYFGLVFIATFPWAFYAWTAYFSKLKQWKNRKAHSDDWFLVIWVALIVLFFAMSKSILAGYLIPIVIPLAILTAKYLCQDIDWSINLLLRRFNIVVGVLFLTLGIASVVIPFIPEFALDRNILLVYFGVLAIASLVGGIYVLKNRSSLKRCAVAFIMIMLVAGNVGFSAGQYLSQKSARAFVAPIDRVMQQDPNAQLAGFDYLYDLQFYSKRTMWLVGSGGELGSTAHMVNSGADQHLLTMNQFWQMWNSDQVVMVVVRKDEYHRYFEKKGLLLAHTQKYYLLVNHQR